MAVATREDVIARYMGEPLDEEVLAVVDIRLNDAELILRNRIPDLLTRILDPEHPEYRDIVIMIESEMVLRLIRNPEGYSQESDGNYSYAIYQAVASGRLEVLGPEWDLLGSGAGMYVITPQIGGCLQEGALDPCRAGWDPPWWRDW